MGYQQMLLIILGVIIVGVAIAVGMWLFGGSSISSNKDAIVNDLLNIGQYAYRYKLRPEPMGGGGTQYSGFVLPQRLSSNDNAAFTVAVTPARVTITATSSFGYGTIVAVLDSAGVIGNYTYNGEFQ